MEIVYSIFIGIIAGMIASKIVGMGLQCRRDRIQALNLKGCQFGEQLKRRRFYNAVGSPVVLFRRTK